MKINARKFFRHAFFVISLLAANAANAVIIVSSGVTVRENEHFDINTAASSITYNPGAYILLVQAVPQSLLQ